MEAIILAGGKGERLMPYTRFIPKVLMPLGNKSVLEFLIDLLLKNECKKIYLALGDEADYIQNFIEKNKEYRNKVFFSREVSPLSTAGPIKLLEKDINGDFIAMNGDVIAEIDFKKFFDAHKRSGKIATIALFKETISTERWAIETDQEGNLLNHIYKPNYEHYVSTGIFVFKPEIFKFIENDESITFPALFDKLISSKNKIGTYIIEEDWVHIRRLEDYDKVLDRYGSANK